MRTQKLTLALAVIVAALATAYVIAYPPNGRDCTDDCPMEIE